MKITNTLYVVTRKAWRAWLKKHYKTEKEIWLVYYRKQTGQPRIPYNEAVEEALCFGWIDSIIKTLDNERVVQRFSPRRPKSSYSQTNQERLRKLMAQGKVAKEVLASMETIPDKQFKVPSDIAQALQGNERAWENFQKFSEAYQRIRIAYIDSARRRPEEFRKRLRHFIVRTEKNKQFGFGIEDYF